MVVSNTNKKYRNSDSNTLRKKYCNIFCNTEYFAMIIATLFAIISQTHFCCLQV